MELLGQEKDGLRYTELTKRIHERNADFKPNTIAGSISNLVPTYPNEVYKPSRGLFRHLMYYKPAEPEEPNESIPSEPTAARPSESDFYEPFAYWLKNELEEVTHAIALGGRIFGDKWGTPDVIGKYQSRPGDIIKGATEIVSAEIKADTAELIAAFGQACAYKLFSHKAYLVIPRDSQDEEISRLDSLCQIFGIGLITFDVNVESPDFRILMRAVRHEPDLFYTNKYMPRIETRLFS